MACRFIAEDVYRSCADSADSGGCASTSSVAGCRICGSGVLQVFPGLSADCRELSHGSTHDARAGRSALPQVESRAWPEAGRLPDADETSEGEE